jgi:small-conductance mechanosensitive channel
MQPLKSQGVIEMQDSAMIIRVKFMTKPGDQWLVRKRVYQDIREIFAREGIKFAHREVTVRLADEHVDDLPAHKKEALAGAVQAGIDEDFMDVNGGGDDR